MITINSKFIAQTPYMLIIIAILIIASAVFVVFTKNPFLFPYFRYSFDVSGKRNVDFESCIDMFLNDPEKWQMLLKHEHRIQNWETDCENYIASHHFKKHRRRQFEKVKNLHAAYIFKTVRYQTRYRQVNYSRIPYKAEVVQETKFCDFKWLVDRYRKLEAINHATTLKNYRSQDQRKLMTRALRKQIMERDDYTCQICGKYMPDEIGLQIDHIVPVSRGGKTIPSNLRVLCSKCNAKKGNKYDGEM